MSADDDSLLWARARDGDGEGFGLLFDRHQGRVYAHASRLLERTDAEDVTAAAFLELWRRRADVRVVNGSVLPWLLVTTSNLARNVHRSTRRYRRLLDALPRGQVAADPTEHAFADDPTATVRPDLAAALRALSALDQQLVSLVMLEGCSQADAAEALGLTEAAVKSRMHRVRTRLRAVPSLLDPVQEAR